MSVSFNSCVGYYVVGTKKTRRVDSKSIRCENGHNGEGSFCSRCGGELTFHTEEVEEWMDTDDLPDREIEFLDCVYKGFPYLFYFAPSYDIVTQVFYFSKPLPKISVLPHFDYCDGYDETIDGGGTWPMEPFLTKQEVMQLLVDSGIWADLETVYDDLRLEFGMVGFYS